MADISVTINPSRVGPLKQAMNSMGAIPAHFPKPSQQFSASVANDPANAGVTWSVEQGGGSIDDRGLFTPPEAHGRSFIKATSVTDKSKSAMAEVFYHCEGQCLLHKA